MSEGLPCRKYHRKRRANRSRRRKFSVREQIPSKISNNLCLGTVPFGDSPCWFRRAASYIAKNPGTRCAFISTDSITQGAQLSAVWPTLLREVRIAFAYESVRWHPRMLVNCVIIGLEARTERKADDTSPVSVFFAAKRDAETGSVEFERRELRTELAPHLQPGIPFVDLGSRSTNLCADAPTKPK